MLMALCPDSACHVCEVMYFSVDVAPRILPEPTKSTILVVS